MTKVPSPLRAPAEFQSDVAETSQTDRRIKRCRDCGEPLDVWNSCPNLPANEARLRSSVLGPAYCGKPSNKPWNFAVDMPGVGRVPMSTESETPRATLRGREKVAGEIPAPLDRQLSDELLIQIAFAAKNVARRNIDPPYYPYCHDCGQMVALPRTPHDVACWTGRVLELFGEMEAVSNLELNTNRKEAAPAEAESRAEDGIPSRGDFGEPWHRSFDGDLIREKIFDRDGALVLVIDRQSNELAGHIVDCVNTAAANPAVHLAVAANGGAHSLSNFMGIEGGAR